MGIFDFLKKKSQPVSTDKTSQVEKPVIPDIPVEKFNFPTTNPIHDQIEAAIATNPNSAQFRTVQKTNAKYTILDLSEYVERKKPLSFVAFDLETTGLNPVDDAIVEIGAVRVVDGQITDRYHQMIDPQRPIPEAATAVNNITDTMLSGMPKIYEALPDFLSFVGKDILIAHNAKFDSAFITQACLRYRFEHPRKYFDSMLLSPYWPELESKSLSSFLKMSGIENDQAHRALSDAEAVAKLVCVSVKKASFSYDNSSRCREDVPVIDHKLSGLRFCFTGDISGYSRAELEKTIKEHDGRMTQSVSSRTNYLVVGIYEDLGSSYVSGKHKAANEIIAAGGKIQIITADQFFQMLK